MFDWINRNKTWLFSGVGVAILAAAFGLFWNENQNMNALDQSSSARAGDSSVVVNVPGTASGITVYQALSSISPAQHTTPLPEGISAQRSNASDIQVTLVSVQTGLIKNLYMSPRGTLQALHSSALSQFRLSNSADVGMASLLELSWALIDTSIENDWRQMRNWKMAEIRAFLKSKDGEIHAIHFWEMGQTLADVDAPEKITFHIYPVPDYRPPEPNCVR